MASSSDAWDWSVNDVLAFFRGGVTEYVDNAPDFNSPPMNSFLTAIEEHEVDGRTLLLGIDSTTLGAEFGVKKLRLRTAIIRCRDKLRAQSPKYAADQQLTILAPLSRGIIASASPAIAPLISTPESVAENGKQQEYVVLDSNGRKRRKLDLTATSPAVPETSPSTSAVIVQPVLSATKRTRGYLPDAALSVEEIFFGTTEVGHEIKHEEPAGDVEHYTPKEGSSHPENFRFSPQDKATGDIHAINKRMQRFLLEPEYVDLPKRDGTAALALLPYKDDSQGVRSAMVFEERQDSVVALRENASQLGRHTVSHDEAAPDAVEITNIEDEVLPLYGELDGDGEVELTDDDDGSGDMAEEEDDDDFESFAKWSAFIDQYVADLALTWQQKRAAEEGGNNRAWRVWNMTEKKKSIRDGLVARAQTQVDHLSSRLTRLRESILDAEWRSEARLDEACACLDETVKQREEVRWKISIWQRHHEPGHTIKRTSTKASTAPKSHSKSGPTFVPDPDDLIDYSPAPAQAPEEVQQAEIVYDADDDEYHSAATSPAPTPGSFRAPLDGFVVQSDGEDNAVGGAADFETSEADMPDAFDAASSGKESSFAPESAADEDEDELPSPSTFIAARKFKSSPQTPIKTSSTPTGPKPKMFVDLSNLTSKASSSSSKSKKRSGKGVTAVLPSDPHNATPAEIDTWDYQELLKGMNRHHLLIIWLRAIGIDGRKRLATFIREATVPKFQEMLLKSCEALQKNRVGASLDDDAALGTARELYIRYLFPHSAEEEVNEPSPEMFRTILIPGQASMFSRALSSYLKKQSIFGDKQTPTSKPGSSNAPVIISSSDERTANGSGGEGFTPIKARKRQPKRSVAAQQVRKLAAERERRYNESQTTDSAQLAAMIGSDSGPAHVDINPVRSNGEPPVYILDSIARRMKPHQIDGVRFLWREVTASGASDAQGCILAHTMGLGKTMQAIAFLVAVTEAAHSNDKRMRLQLPQHLCPKGIANRNLRVLVLCPPALLQNWCHEVEMWSEGRLGRTRTIETANKIRHLDYLEEWTQWGGVIIVGYSLFRSICYEDSVRGRKGLEETKRLRSMLLESSEIVIADEAHTLKDDTSDTASAAKQLRTESRIALTGTPMSNDVEEIYSLVSFVAPDFLGEKPEFRADYQEPIEAGLYKESSYVQRRKSTMKLKVLHAQIQPKVNRANIEVLRGSLKSKTEFVVTLPLTPVQDELYRKTIMNLLHKEGSEKASSVAIFGWLAVLQLLTNHPQCFRRKLLEDPKRSKGKKTKRDTTASEVEADVDADDGTPAPTESGVETPPSLATSAADSAAAADKAEAENVRALGFSEDMIQSLLESFDNSMDPSLSAKTAVFVELLERCIECQDKVLVFSGSILTLNFLGDLLRHNRHRFGDYRRIDGAVNPAARMSMLEDFQKPDVNVMLISTRAGGVGLNIQNANRVFIFDFGFNPTNEEQAIGRAYRLGQTKPVYVYRLMTGGTFETNIYNKQLFKSSLASRVVDKKNPRRAAEKEVREYLYEPKEVRQEPLQEWMGKDPNVLDQLLAKHGPGKAGKVDTMIRAIKTMETLQEEEIDAPLNDEEQREVNQEIAAGLQRPRGRRPGSTQVAMPNGVASTQAAPTATIPRFNGAPPPSTYSAARPTQVVRLNMAGLPFPK